MNVGLIYKFYLPIYGGTETLMYTIAKGLLKYGVNVQIITTRFSKNLPQEEVYNGVMVHRLDLYNILFGQVDILKLSTYSKLKKIIKDLDIVDIFSSTPSQLLIKSIYIARRLNKTIIWHPIFLPGRFKLNRKLILRFFGSLWDNIFVEKFALSANSIVTHTSIEAKYFSEIINRHNVHIPLYMLGECIEEVNIGKRRIMKALNKYGLTVYNYILSVGRITWYKGYDLLIDAWNLLEKEFPGLKLVIVGSDWGYKKSLLLRVKKYGIKNIIFLDSIPFKDLHALYEGAIALVALSKYETFYRTIVEAWSHKTPAIVLEHLRHKIDYINEGGVLFVKNDAKDIARALRLLIVDPNLRNTLGTKGYRVFKSKFTVDRYIARLLKVYEEAYALVRHDN